MTQAWLFQLEELTARVYTCVHITKYRSTFYNAMSLEHVAELQMLWVGQQQQNNNNDK